MFMCDLAQTQYGKTALILASSLGRTEIVKLLVGAGADKGAKDNVSTMYVVRWWWGGEGGREGGGGITCTQYRVY